MQTRSNDVNGVCVCMCVCMCVCVCMSQVARAPAQYSQNILGSVPGYAVTVVSLSKKFSSHYLTARGDLMTLRYSGAKSRILLGQD